MSWRKDRFAVGVLAQRLELVVNAGAAPAAAQHTVADLLCLRYRTG